MWEVDNLNLSTTAHEQMLIEALNTTLDHLTHITPEMPCWLSPFANSLYGTPDEYAAMLERVFAQTHFRKGDVFVPQDCVGAGGLSI